MAFSIRTQNSEWPRPPSGGLAKTGLPDEDAKTTQKSSPATPSKLTLTILAVGTDRLSPRLNLKVNQTVSHCPL